MAGKRRHYKSIDFDLDTVKLGEVYGDYRKAYKDMRKFMTAYGFSHRQGSVYNSLEKLLETDIIVLIDYMMEELPWVKTCVKAIDVTSISQQHSLLPLLHADEEDFDL